MKISPSQFRTKEFKANFVGSYGFLPKVEPKVDNEEAQVLAELSEYLSGSQFKAAEQRLLRFIKERRNPTDPETESKDVSAALIFTLGNLYLQSGRLADAEQSYQIAIDRHPAYRRAHKNLALVYAKQSKMELAKPHLEKAIELGQSDAQTFGLLGAALLNEGKHLAAEAAYRHAYLLNPNERDWQLGLTQALVNEEKWSEAAVMIQSLVDAQSDAADLWRMQANCYIQMGQELRAAENYEILRLKGLADERDLNQLGDVYSQQKQPLLALGAYLSAMKISKTVEVKRSLTAAGYLLSLDAPAEATRLIDELEERAGDNLTSVQKRDVFLIRGDIARAAGKLEAAGEQLRQALALDETDGATRVRLARLYGELAEEQDEPGRAGHYQVEAATMFRTVINSPDAKVSYEANLRFGQLLFKDRRFTEAVPLLEAATRLKPGNKSLEQFLRRVKRASERQEAKKERERLEREAALEAAKKTALEK